MGEGGLVDCAGQGVDDGVERSVRERAWGGRLEGESDKHSAAQEWGGDAGCYVYKRWRGVLSELLECRYGECDSVREFSCRSERVWRGAVF